MSRDKQIKEMAKDICVECSSPHCIPRKNCSSWIYAEKAVDKGYRKSADVAREIISIIEQRMTLNDNRLKGISEIMWQAIYNARIEAYRDIKEIIEQKYTEDTE